MNIALFASGNGSNVMAILESLSHHPQANFVTLVCDNPQAGVLEKIKAFAIDTLVVSPHDFDSRQAWEEAMIQHLEEKSVDLICLAGFMRILSSPMLSRFNNRIINIHPALLPSFPGRYGIEDAYRAGVTETGVTIHYVDEGIDTGDIIYQEALTVNPAWTLEELETEIHAIEHRIYPKIILKFIEDTSEEE